MSLLNFMKLWQRLEIYKFNMKENNCSFVNFYCMIFHWFLYGFSLVFPSQVDRSVTELKYMDPICDVLYHIKYMFTGDSIKTDVEGIIRGLRPALQRRLRFITHLNLDSIEV